MPDILFSPSADYANRLPEFSQEFKEDVATKALDHQSFRDAAIYVAKENLFSEMKRYLTPINVMVASAGVCGISENSMMQMQNILEDVLFFQRYPKGVDTSKPFDEFTFLESKLSLEQRTWLYFYYQVINFELCNQLEIFAEFIRKKVGTIYYIEDPE